MIMIKKNHFKYLVGFHLFSLFCVTLFYYYTLNHIDFTQPLMVKYFSEIAVLIMILSITLTIFYVTYVYYKSVKVYAEMDKLIDYSKYHNFTEEHKALQRLDELGKKIVFLFTNINEISNKRKIKLSALYELIDYVTAAHQEHLIIINVKGDILFVSDRFVNAVHIDKILLQTLNIRDLITINIKTLLVQLDNARKEIKLDEISFIHPDISKKLKSLTAYAVYNTEKQLSNVVINFNI